MSVSRKTASKTEQRLYGIWHNMKTRCYNPNTQHFDRYGGRGITVCEEWKNDFDAFYAWAISHGYADNLTLDRKDGNGNYSPSNCQWVDMLHQNNNTSKNRYITHNGEVKTASEWARQYGIHQCVFLNRIRRGWPFERAIQPTRRYKRQQEKESDQCQKIHQRNT